jgi:hypothetical protein
VQARMKQDLRIIAAEMQNVRWFAFALRCDGDVHDALEWLEKAYEAARGKPDLRVLAKKSRK